MTHPKSGLVATALCLAALLLPAPLPAQITFERTYGGPGDDIGYSVQQTADGGYVIVGAADSTGGIDFDVCLVRTDSNGDAIWTRTYGGIGQDEGRAVQQTTDGGYVIAGSTASFGAGYNDFYLIRTSPEGDPLWTRTFGGAYEDLAHSVEQTADSGFIVAGLTNGGIYLVKTNAGGETLWTRVLGDGWHDEGNWVKQTIDGGCIVVGSTDRSGNGDVYLLKTNADGDTSWTRTFGGGNVDYGCSVQQTTDSGYIIAGCTHSFGAGGSDAYVIKTNVHGDTLWTRTFGGDEPDKAQSAHQTADGGYIIAGTTESFGAGNDDVYLIKTDASGDTLWTRTFGGGQWEFGNSVQQTADGGYIIAGYYTSFGANGADIYLIKTDSLGRVGVEEPETPPTRAPSFSLSCSPNPTSGSVTISLSPSIPSSLSALLRLFDASGRMVLSLPVSTSPFPLSTSDLPSGAYFVRLDFGAHHASTRLVVQR